MTFDLHIGIDYSGAAAPESRSKTLQVYATIGEEPERVIAVPEEGRTHWNWCRKEIAEHLIDLAKTDATFIAGIDPRSVLPRATSSDMT